jgi:hypothetical protein
MEGLLALTLVILLILIITIGSRLLALLRELTNEVSAMRLDFRHWTERWEARDVAEVKAPEPRARGAVSGGELPMMPEPIGTTPRALLASLEPPLSPEPRPIPDLFPAPLEEETPLSEAIPPSEPSPVPEPISEPEVLPVPEPLPEADPVDQPAFSIFASAPTGEPAVEIPARQGFFERNPDLEKFIGENLISKIGIAILVIAIGFFVKYAIDQDWIGPAGRAGIGVLCGGILIGLAHRLQKTYKAFSSVLVGGGIAVLYFSIALAYKEYGLFSQPVAFVIMLVITILAIMLSLLYNRQEVAIIALAGGFAVPFMVSNGSGNYVTLFTYLLLLNAGLLAIAYRKAWRLLNFIAFAATVLLFAGWLGTLPPGTPHRTFIGGLLFATIFYLLFLAVNLAHNVRERKKFIASDFGILLASNALYFSAGLYLLHAADAAYQGLFSAALGVLNFALCFLSSAQAQHRQEHTVPAGGCYAHIRFTRGAVTAQRPFYNAFLGCRDSCAAVVAPEVRHTHPAFRWGDRMVL